MALWVGGGVVYWLLLEEERVLCMIERCFGGKDWRLNDVWVRCYF